MQGAGFTQLVLNTAWNAFANFRFLRLSVNRFPELRNATRCTRADTILSFPLKTMKRNLNHHNEPKVPNFASPHLL